jgi:hypothetical protein
MTGHDGEGASRRYDLPYVNGHGRRPASQAVVHAHEIRGRPPAVTMARQRSES